MLSFLWATFETASRGFLLGFGAMVCKEVFFSELAESKRSNDDSQPAPAKDAATGSQPQAVSRKQLDSANIFFKARVAGLGVGCLLVGASILLPAGVRHKMLALQL